MATGMGSRPIVPAGKSRFCSRDVRDIRRRQTELRHANRIEDQPHAVVLLPEHRRVTDARQALDVVEDAQRDKVREKKASCCGSSDCMTMTARRSGDIFLTVIPLPHDFRRQLWLGQFLAILGLDLCDIDVGPDLEREPDAHVPIVRTRRIEVEKVVDAGKLQFDRARHGFPPRPPHWLPDNRPRSAPPAA